jgi:hypothetical protein
MCNVIPIPIFKSLNLKRDVPIHGIIKHVKVIMDESKNQRIAKNAFSD